MEAEQAEAARRAKEAVEHYTFGPRDITFLTNRAAAYFRIGKVSPGSRPPPPPPATRRPLTLWDMFSTRSARGTATRP